MLSHYFPNYQCDSHETLHLALALFGMTLLETENQS